MVVCVWLDEMINTSKKRVNEMTFKKSKTLAHLEGNYAKRGGGMAIDHAELRLHRTAVVLNHAFEEGGGLLWTCNDPKLCTTMIDSLTHFQRNRAIGGGHSI